MQHSNSVAGESEIRFDNLFIYLVAIVAQTAWRSEEHFR